MRDKFKYFMRRCFSRLKYYPYTVLYTIALFLGRKTEETKAPSYKAVRATNGYTPHNLHTRPTWVAEPLKPEGVLTAQVGSTRSSYEFSFGGLRLSPVASRPSS